MKYQNEGGPDLARGFEPLRRVTRPSAPHVVRLLDYVIFNALIGNHDAHAKKFSLLHTNRAPSAPPSLALLYDALSTAVYPSLTSKMAMKLGNKYKFSEVQVRHWEQFADQAGLTKALTKKCILALAQALPATARRLQSDPERGFADNSMVREIITLIEQRCALTIRRLLDTE